MGCASSGPTQSGQQCGGFGFTGCSDCQAELFCQGDAQMQTCLPLAAVPSSEVPVDPCSHGLTQQHAECGGSDFDGCERCADGLECQGDIWWKSSNLLLLLLILVRKVSLRPTGSVAGLVLMAANSVTVGWTVLSSMLTCFVWLLIHVRAVVPPKVVNNVVALVSLDAVTARLSCFAKEMLKCRRVFLLLPFLHLRCLLICAVMASPNKMLSVVDLILMAVSGVLMDWNVKETSGGNLASRSLLILVREVSLRPTGSVVGLVLMAANSVTVGWTVLSSMLTCFVWLLIHVRAVVPPKVVNNVVALVLQVARNANQDWLVKDLQRCKPANLLIPAKMCPQ